MTGAERANHAAGFFALELQAGNVLPFKCEKVPAEFLVMLFQD
jgi:hypothetical protein